MSHALTSIGCGADRLRSDPMYPPNASANVSDGAVASLTWRIEDLGHVIDRRADVAERRPRRRETGELPGTFGLFHSG